MNPEVVAALAAERVWAAHLVEIAFASETVRLTSLDRHLTLPDGTSWRGLGATAAVGALEQPDGEGAPSATLTLSGLDADVYAALIAAETEARNRLVRIGLALWSGATAADAVFAGRMTLFTGRIDRIVYASRPETAGDGVTVAFRRTVTATVESLFAENRARAKTALYSRAQQRLWWPGDAGLDHVARAADKQVDWPQPVFA